MYSIYLFFYSCIDYDPSSLQVLWIIEQLISGWEKWSWRSVGGGGVDGRLCQLFTLGHVTVNDDCDAASRGAADMSAVLRLRLCDKTRHLKCLKSSSKRQTAVTVEAFSLQIFYLLFFAKATEMIFRCCCFSVSVKCSSSPLGESNDRRCSVQQDLSRLFQAQGDFFKYFKEALKWRGSALYGPTIKPAGVFGRDTSWMASIFVFLRCVSRRKNKKIFFFILFYLCSTITSLCTSYLPYNNMADWK